MKRAVVMALLAAGGSAGAQVNLLPSTSWGFAPIASAWHFNTPIVTPTISVADVGEAAVPFQVRATIAERWTFDVTGAYAVAAVHGTTGSSLTHGSSDTLLHLEGPTDVKLRMSGSLGDRWVLTAGLNLPAGITRLSSDQTTVLQTAGAPALGLPISAYGTGIGGTLGLIGVTEVAGWTLALGASVEQRTEYTPIALAIAAGSSDTRLTPGTAGHLSLGGDRTLGSSRLSVLVLTDVYGTDDIVITSAGAETGRTHYQLGPQLAALTRLDFGGDRWSEGALSLSARHRSVFTDADGKSVAGSDGTYLEGSLGGVLGGIRHPGLVIGVDGRWHSGLSFTSALVGAAVTGGGATLGLEFPIGFRFAVHGQYGTFDTGVTRATGVGGAIMMSFFGRRTAQ